MTPREFAIEVVRRLRDAGHEAYWAGGCVRDQLLCRDPKDYDVATDARPKRIRHLFGHRRTLAIGAAFGVITVLGPKGAGQIEVTTFRQDEDYSDGRHPDRVTFSSAREDASRRDFTINGLFYDPLAEKVIDFVGGQKDLAAKRVRAIGDPRQRIEEDKLRMLRAVRFTSTLGFTLDPETKQAVCSMAAGIRVVSQERITAELRRVLTDPNRVAGIRLLLETGLADQVFPEVVPGGTEDEEQFEQSLRIVDRLSRPELPLVLAGLLLGRMSPEEIAELGLRWRLSNKEQDRAAWLAANAEVPLAARSLCWSRLQPVLIDDRLDDLLALAEAIGGATGRDVEPIAWCRQLLTMPPEELDPPPLLTGGDLIRHGVPRGPVYRALLTRVRAAQLDRQISTIDEALRLVDRTLAEQKG